MELYKILIVDDEEEIRLGIIKKIKWEEYGFTICGDAENGQDALEKAEKFQPDLIMTDIKMPYMDGIELCKKLSESMPSCKIIVFSGCDDFEYAQKAIKYNVIEYVLKPINSVELIEVLKKLKTKMDEEFDEKRNFEILNKYYVESIPIIREQFLIGTIEGRVSEEEWHNEVSKLQIKITKPSYITAVVHLDYEINDKSPYYRKNTLMFISIKKAVDEIMCKYCEFVSFLYLNKVVIIGGINNDNDKNVFINALNEVCKYYKRVVGLSISAGIGSIEDNAEKITDSYKSAENALEYRVILGSERAIYIDDVEPDNSINLQLSEDVEKRLLNAIKISSAEEISKVVCSLFGVIENTRIDFNSYKIYVMEIITSLLKLVQSYNLNVDDIFGENFNCYSYLKSFNSANEITEWIKEKCINISSQIKKERINSSQVLVQKAKNYVESNYDDSELSVDKICSELHVSPTYFSTIFKKETDMNFVNYLTDKRLEEAVKLLNTTDDKTYMIAEKVGYVEANYFSYVFKRKYGVSPSKYRKS